MALRGVALCAGILGCMQPSAMAQTPASLQIPYISTGIGIPTGSTQTVCSAVIKDTLGSVGNNCLPSQATLSSPQSVIVDPKTNNLFIADNADKQIRVIYNSGSAELQAIVNGYNTLTVLTTSSVLTGHLYDACGEHSGSYTAITSVGGLCGTSAVSPVGLALDPGGNIVDTEGSSRIRMRYTGGSQGAALLKTLESAQGTISPVVGYQYALVYSSANAYYGDGGNATQAMLNQAKGVYIDANENIYIADSKNNAIRMINGTTGIITTIAGSSCTVATGVTLSSVGATNSALGYPSAASSVGGCTAGSTGDAGSALAAKLNTPYDVLMDASGNLYIADSGNARVRVIYNGSGTIPGVSNPVVGAIYTVAGGGTLTVGGAATQILLKSATGLGFDAAGNLYIADTTGAKIWEVDAKTQVATIIAGGGTSSAIGTACSSTFAAGPTKTYTNGDGCLGPLATLTAPTGRISFDAAGNLYVADSTANVVRKISHAVPAAASTAVGSTSPIALAFAPLTAITTGAATFGEQGVSTGDFRDAGGSTCNSGAALAAGQICYLNVSFTPTLPGLRVGAAEVITSGSTVFGSNYLSGVATGSAIALDSGTQISLGSGIVPAGVAADPSGVIYVSDTKSGSVLRYASATTTAAPTTILSGLSSPGQVVVDGQGNVLVADTGNNRVAIYGYVTGKVTYMTGYSSPKGVEVDGQGNIYVADTGNNQVVQVTPQGIGTTVSTSLSTPTQLSFDGAGNLYIIDSGNSRVIELPGGTGTQVTVPTGTFTAAALGIDAAGDLYVLDKAGLQVGFISAQGNLTTTPLTGLLSPTSLSIDSLGNMYIADSQAGAVTVLNRQQISLSFYPENVGQKSTFSSFVLTNIGNSSLTFTGSAPYVGTGSTADFTVSPSASNGCSTAAVASGIGCSVSAVFSPVALGSFTEKLAFPSNAGNASTAGVSLIGSGVNLASSNLTISSSPSATSAISYGSAVTLSLTLSQSGTTAATGSILLTINGIKIKTLAVANGVATYTFNPQSGTYVVAGQYSGDTNYASSYATLILTVTPAVTTTKLVYTGAGLSTTGSTAASYTLTATVSSTASGVTGVVSFSAGSTTLGMASLNASGVATLTLSSSTASNFAFIDPVFTANYLGNTNFSTSTSNSVTAAGDFGVSALSTTLSEPQGSVASTTITVLPYFGVSGNVTFACSNLPSNALCRFLPNYVNFAGTLADASGSVQLQLYTNVSPTLAKVDTAPRRRRTQTEEAGIASAGMLLLLCLRRRHPFARRMLLMLLLTVLPLAASMGLTGCGGAYYNYATYTTPVGTTVFTLTATSANGVTESIPITMVVGASN